jgi:hypothetical protein
VYSPTTCPTSESPPDARRRNWKLRPASGITCSRDESSSSTLLAGTHRLRITRHTPKSLSYTETRSRNDVSPGAYPRESPMNRLIRRFCAPLATIVSTVPADTSHTSRSAAFSTPSFSPSEPVPSPSGMSPTPA